MSGPRWRCRCSRCWTRGVGRCRLTLLKPTLKAPGYERLKLEHEKLLSNCFQTVFNFNLRRYTWSRGTTSSGWSPARRGAGRWRKRSTCTCRSADVVWVPPPAVWFPGEVTRDGWRQLSGVAGVSVSHGVHGNLPCQQIADNISMI